MTGTRQPAWLLDEVANAGRENLDPQHVARYDDKEDAGADAEVEVLVGLGLDHTSTIVDLGAGTGQLVLAAAGRCSRAIAVDVSRVMLDVLRSKVRARALENVELVEAGFLTYEHQGPPADFVYSRWALHHLPDFWKAVALTRIRSTLRPGGTLRLVDLVFSFPPSEAVSQIERWCATVPAQAPEGAWVRADIEEHVREEHSTYTWLLEPMIERCGFRIESASYSEDGVNAAYIAKAI